MEKKLKLKAELLKKIQEDENERIHLENQLACVEKDEFDIIKKFKGENEDGQSETLEIAYKTIKLRNQSFTPKNYKQINEEDVYDIHSYNDSNFKIK